jgi:SAM-dependent methyltransferase
MLAPATLPQKYRQWNDAHGAPFGRPIPRRHVWDFLLPRKSPEQLGGPFSVQPNNTTREFEYPWAFESARLKSGMDVVELGGGLSGLQFVLNQHGCRVVNVDPGMEARGVGWPCDLRSMEKLNHLFGTNIELFNTTIENAALGENTMDRAFCISVIEHLPDTDIIEAMRHVHRCLKFGGLFILTVDLFLNLSPFCSRASNQFGINRNVKWITELENWKLMVGSPQELFGFDTFNADAILANLEKYMIGRNYPAMAQCLVLQKQ